MLRRVVFVPLTAVVLALAGCPSGGGGGGTNPANGPVVTTFRTMPSQQSIPTSNGVAAAHWSLASHEVVSLHDHIFAAAASPTADLAQDISFGYRKGGSSAWLNQSLETSAGYVDGTGIVDVVQKAQGLTFETYVFAPFAGGADRGLVALVHARNDGADATDCALFSFMNFALGGKPDAASEWAFYDGSAPYGPYMMAGRDAAASGAGNRVIMKPFGAAPAHSSYAAPGPQSPYARVVAGQHLADPTGSLNADGIVCGFEWSINGGGTFAAGQDAWAGFLIAIDESANETGLKQLAQTFAGANGPADILARERAFWDSYHSAETPPPGATAEELALFRQSTAVIKMAQCREPAPRGGQILASLPPGQWNICWPRDASYAIAALARAGHFDEAKAGLQFFLGAHAGSYQAQVGRPYGLSVCRYRGDGTEESDDDGNGPNIEFDGMGLFLWAYSEVVTRSHDTAFLTSTYPAVRDGIASVLASLLGPNNLVKADSSNWERHLRTASGSPDGAKQFAYSSIAAANGLLLAAALANQAGDGANAGAWTSSAAQISGAILSQLSLPDGAIASSVEELAQGRSYAADASVLEAVNFGVIRGSSGAATATMAYIDKSLKAWPLRSPGYLRNDDASTYPAPQNWYDRQEWVFVDLRIASALVRMGRNPDARVLLDWVLAQAGANMSLIPELYDENSSAYQGAVPMVGFGAGAYILATYDYYTQGPT